MSSEELRVVDRDIIAWWCETSDAVSTVFQETDDSGNPNMAERPPNAYVYSYGRDRVVVDRNGKVRYVFFRHLDQDLIYVGAEILDGDEAVRRFDHDQPIRYLVDEVQGLDGRRLLIPLDPECPPRIVLEDDCVVDGDGNQLI